MGLHWNRGLCWDVLSVFILGELYPGEPLPSGDLQGKCPIRSCQSPNDVGTGHRQHIVDCVGRGDDAFSASRSSAASQPADNVARLLVVKRLGI